MTTLIEQIETQYRYAQFNTIPGRIFLDTKVLQYLQDFGEYIFENYRESENYFQAQKGKIKKGTRLFNEIEALHDFFIGIFRAHFEFALAPVVYEEVSASGDKRFIQWFHVVWVHWKAVVSEYENGEAFSKNAGTNYKRAVNDNSLHGSLSGFYFLLVKITSRLLGYKEENDEEATKPLYEEAVALVPG